MFFVLSGFHHGSIVDIGWLMNHMEKCENDYYHYAEEFFFFKKTGEMDCGLNDKEKGEWPDEMMMW
jgi:hypothetical protein